MKCPKCDAENTDTQKYCGECAAPLTDTGDPQTSITKTILRPMDILCPGTMIAGKYRVGKVVGRGGMGIVHQAEDTKLKRKVALKFMPPELVRDNKAKERFLIEAQAAAALSHPNICTIHEIDEDDGKSFIAMEFVEGENLRARLEKGPLAVDECLDIAIQVAEGLDEAHKKGIVHRDIKSSNIMVTDKGQVKIMDFGLAKTKGGNLLTREGSTVGTVAYMSPEQARGEEVDHRTDIWSLGVVLYKLLSGQLPFKGDSDVSILYSVVHEEAQPLRQIKPGIPQELQRIVSRALKKKSESRYQEIRDMLNALSDCRDVMRREETGVSTLKVFRQRLRQPTIFIPAALFSLAVIVGFFLWRYVFQNETRILTQHKPSIAVMEFTNKNEEDLLDFWSEGLTNLVVADLDQSRYIRTIWPYELDELSSILKIPDVKNLTSEDLEKLATKAKISYLLNGNYTKQEEAFVIEVNFINTITGKISSTINLEGVGEDSVFSLVDSITLEAKKVLKLSPDEMETDIDEEIGKITTYSPEAYKYEQEARKYAYVGESSRAIQLLEKAISIDPEFAEAYLTLSIRHDFNANQLLESQYRQKAYELRDRLSVKDRLYVFGSSDRYKKLLEIYPDHSTANISLAGYYRDLEEWDKSLMHMQVVQRNNSHDAGNYESFAEIYRAKGMYSNAHEVLDYYLDNFADHHIILASKATNYLCQGKYREALASLERAMSLVQDAPDDADKVAAINTYTERKGDIHLCMGEFVEAEKIYRSLLTDSGNPFRQGRDRLALLYLLQGRLEESKKSAKEIMRGEGLSLNGLLGYIYLQTDEYKNALIEFEKAFADAYDERGKLTLLCLKGRAYIELNELDNALQTAVELREIIENRLFEKAKRYYDYLSGLIEIKRGNLSKGIDHLARAVTMLPFEMGWYGVTDHALFFDAIADAYHRNGDLNNASIYYNRLTNLNTGRIYFGDIYAKSFYTLGRISEEEGDRAYAIEHYNKFLTLWRDADPGLPELTDARERVAELTR